MKVIKASTAIMPERPDVIQQLEERGRICYKSEKVKDRLKFVQGFIKAKHSSTMEMADIHVSLNFGIHNMASTILNIVDNPYMRIGYSINGAIISGSVRAWRELKTMVPDLTPVIKGAVMASYPDLFFDQMPEEGKMINVLDHAKERYGFACGLSLNPKDEGAFFNAQRVAVKFTVNRAVSHELVRHRGTVALLQESQRYCSYNKDKFGNEVTFIDPAAFITKKNNPKEYKLWETSCKQAEKTYLGLVNDSNLTPQAARTVLPNSCKTEVIMYATLAQWSHIFFMRTAKAAEPSMREVMIPLHKKFKKQYPKMFDKLQRME